MKDLTDVPCSKLTLLERNGRQTLTGYVGKSDDVVALQKTYKPTQINYDVQIRPWPQCEILLTLDKQLAAKDQPKYCSCRWQEKCT